MVSFKRAMVVSYRLSLRLNCDHCAISIYLGHFGAKFGEEGLKCDLVETGLSYAKEIMSISSAV